MTEARFQDISEKVLSTLEKELDPRLTYHNLAHTKDVMAQVVRIAQGEKIINAKDLLLLRIAALFHDTGFLYAYKHHEERSCEIMLDHLKDEDIKPEEIKNIKGMIMATKIPQTPHNKLEEIICDADLDYLGRNDFEKISNGLKEEFLTYGVIKGEEDWDPLQIRFFEAHSYFTKTCQEDRDPKKKKHLQQLKARLPRP
jgi:predicted metal-dependent HD superfamily phosphohydrolase